MSLRPVLLDLASNKFIHTYAAADPSIIQLSIHSYIDHLLLQENNTLLERTLLRLAFDAVSLTIFGQANTVPAAQRLAFKKYTEALTRTNETVSDGMHASSHQFLLTVMMLNNYEVCALWQRMLPGSTKSVRR